MKVTPKVIWSSSVFWLSLLLLLVCSCKTKDLAVYKSLDDVKAAINNNSNSQEQTAAAVTNTTTKSEVTELLTLLQSLNIAYNGKDLNDKMDVLLNKTSEGTKITIQGKGLANYKAEETKDYKDFQQKLISRYDSLFSLQSKLLVQLNFDIQELKKAKAKDVKVRGFQAGTYITIGVVLVLLAILAWIAKRFKLFEKIKAFGGEA